MLLIALNAQLLIGVWKQQHLLSLSVSATIKEYRTLQIANGKQRVLSKDNSSRGVHLRIVLRCGSGVFARDAVLTWVWQW